MTVQTYTPSDFRKQLADRNQFRIAMLAGKPQPLSFSEGTIDLAGKDVLYILERPYDQRVDALIGHALETTARKYKKTWEAIRLTTKYNDKEFKRYRNEVAQRFRRMCEDEFSQTTDIVVPGFRTPIVCSQKGCAYQVTRITEDHDKEGIEKLLRQKGLEGTVSFW